MSAVRIIDGSQGEGGGQILRTSMALACICQTPIRIINVRARRSKPGLLRQHLTAVRAVQTISNGRIQGDTLGSLEINFTPGAISHGEYTFAVGSAGSAMLVFQTVLWPLLWTPGRSILTFTGGTHNPLAPPFDFFDQVFLPLLRRMGARVMARLEQPGFFPAGGGCLIVELEGGHPLSPLHLLERGPIQRKEAYVLLAHLAKSIATRELNMIHQKLGIPRRQLQIHEVESLGPGNALLLVIAAEHCTELFSGFGSKGISAEKIAAAVADEALEYLATDVPVGRHLADQLLIPLALAKGGSFRSLPLTLHSETNIAIIREFLPISLAVTPESATSVRVDVD